MWCRNDIELAKDNRKHSRTLIEISFLQSISLKDSRKTLNRLKQVELIMMKPSPLRSRIEVSLASKINNEILQLLNLIAPKLAGKKLAGSVCREEVRSGAGRMKFEEVRTLLKRSTYYPTPQSTPSICMSAHLYWTLNPTLGGS